MYQIVFFVPETHLEQVKDALFNKGAGKYHNYDRCSWEVLGQGQFRPLQGSNPFLGTMGKLEKTREYRVEMVCQDDVVVDIIHELLRVHPYEEPAYSVVKMEVRG
jgi:hypothetical protein